MSVIIIGCKVLLLDCGYVGVGAVWCRNDNEYLSLTSPCCEAFDSPLSQSLTECCFTQVNPQKVLGMPGFGMHVRSIMALQLWILDNLIQPLGEPVIFIESNDLLIALDYVQSVNVIFKWRSKPQCG